MLALLPHNVADDLDRLLEQFELIRFTKSETNPMKNVKPLLKSFMLDHDVYR